MTQPPDFRALLQRIVNAIDAGPGDVPDLRENLAGAYRAAFGALSAASSPPPRHDTPVQLRPVDRYTLSNAILAAWHKHGNDSWCSIADEVIAALSAAPQQGVPSDWDIVEMWAEAAGMDTSGFDTQHHAFAHLILTRYGAQAAPVAVAEPDCGSVLLLAAIIREVDGSNKLGAAPLAEAILSHRAITGALPLPEAQP
jgi:hypothetical protein